MEDFLFIGLFLMVVIGSIGAFVSPRAQHRYQQPRTQRVVSDIEPSDSEPQPEPVLIESESVTPEVVDVAEEDCTDDEQPDSIPTGVTGVVRVGRKQLRCTEFDVAGELYTEVVRIDRKGRIIEGPRLESGAFREVADRLFNLQAAS